MCVSGNGTFGRKMEKGLKELSSPGVWGWVCASHPKPASERPRLRPSLSEADGVVGRGVILELTDNC